VDGDTLTLGEIEAPGPYVVVWGSHPFVRQ
jgi:hypothetical protein